MVVQASISTRCPRRRTGGADQPVAHPLRIGMAEIVEEAQCPLPGPHGICTVAQRPSAGTEPVQGIRFVVAVTDLRDKVQGLVVARDRLAVAAEAVVMKPTLSQVFASPYRSSVWRNSTSARRQ